MVIGGIVFLGWNEGNYVKTLKDIQHTQENTVKVDCDLSPAGQNFPQNLKRELQSAVVHSAPERIESGSKLTILAMVFYYLVINLLVMVATIELKTAVVSMVFARLLLNGLKTMALL